MTQNPTDTGFTLIELLVVMAIIATLASLAVVGIPAYMREADRTACREHLSSIYKHLLIYNSKYKGFPTASGPEFVFALWTSKIVDHTQSDAKIFFSAGTGNQPPEDVDSLTADDIDYTGPDQSNMRVRIRPQMRNANDFAIASNRVPAEVEGEEDLSQFPHAGTGINVLFAGGAVEWFDTEDDFGGDYPIIGPDSPIKKLQTLVPDRY